VIFINLYVNYYKLTLSVCVWRWSCDLLH